MIKPYSSGEVVAWDLSVKLGRKQLRVIAVFDCHQHRGEFDQ